MKKIGTFTVKRAGRRDGRPFRFTFSPPFKQQKPSYPSVDQQSPAEYESVLRGSAEASLAQLSKTWHSEDKVLHSRFCQAINRRQALIPGREEIHRNHRNARADVETLQQSIDSFQNPEFNPKWAMFFLVVIGISEFLLNANAFSILGEGRLLTYGIAAGMGVGLPLLAHSWGKALKQQNPSNMDLKIRAWSPIIASLLIIAVSVIRALFFSKVVDELAGMHPIPYAILLMIINAVLCLIARQIAYHSSRTQEVEYRTTLERLLRAEAKLKQASQKAADLDLNMAAAEDEIVEARHNRAERFEEIHAEAGKIISSFRFHVQTYRRENISARDGRPRCFDREPVDPAIPPNLLRISWNCNPFDLTEVDYVFKNNNNGSDGNIAPLLLTGSKTD